MMSIMNNHAPAFGPLPVADCMRPGWLHRIKQAKHLMKSRTAGVLDCAN